MHARVYSLRGALVSEPVHSNQAAGYHEVQFDGTEHASGVYMLSVEWNDAKPENADGEVSERKSFKYGWLNSKAVNLHCVDGFLLWSPQAV